MVDLDASGRAVVLPTSALWVNRVIWLALVAGQVVFAVVIAIVLANGGGGSEQRLPTTLFAGVGGAMVLAGAAVSAVMRWRGVSDEPGRLRQEAIRAMILPMAVLEGASLFCLAMVLVSGKPWPIAVVPVASLLVQLSLFPKRTARRRSTVR